MMKVVAGLLALSIATSAKAETIAQVDLAKPPLASPAPADAMIVLRAHAPGMIGDNRISFYRWDAARQALELDPQSKPREVRLTYSYSLFGGKKGERALRVAIVPAGDYVLGSRTFNANYTDTFCLGAPRFTLAAGETAYVGEYEMFALEKMADGERRNAMRYSTDLEGARGALRAAYPDRAASMRLWEPVDGATFACVGDEFLAYALPRR